MSLNAFRHWIGAAALVAVPAIVAPLPANAQNVAPTAQSDYGCLVLMAQRRATAAASQQLAPDQKVRTVRNLDVIASFYQGRISQYPVEGALQAYNNARSVVESLSGEQLDIEAERCAQFFVAVDDITNLMGQDVDPNAR